MGLKDKKLPKISDFVRKYSILTIVLSVILLAIGVLFCIAPLASTSVVIWIAFGGLALAGLVGIFHFIWPGKGEKRDGFALFIGIVLVLIFVVLLVTACCFPAGYIEIGGKKEPASGFACFSAGLVSFFAIFFGVIAICAGILSICTIGSIEKGKKALTIVSAIIGIILGVLMIVFPFVYSWVAGIIAGVYFIIVSIFGIVYGIKGVVAAHKIKKAGTEVVNEIKKEAAVENEVEEKK